MKWDVPRALWQMRGTEHAARLLLGDLDRELADRDSYGIKSGHRTIGIAVATTVLCALYCEYGIKTFHASLSDGVYKWGHVLARRPQDQHDGLYDHLETQYKEVRGAEPHALNLWLISLMHTREASCPEEWAEPIYNVRSTLQLGSTNFEDWRYGYPETGNLSNGIPKALFCIGKALELATRTHTI